MFFIVGKGNPAESLLDRPPDFIKDIRNSPFFDNLLNGDFPDF